ncbi:tail protein, putative [Babesia caballi]|uniref:Tail protein, putative n=1 Tax=Babesia caballi TaxID=5871 RepID=A0AAV4LWW2_BABCB|nr:tail protein, putative [Babesia caballi]
MHLWRWWAWCHWEQRVTASGAICSITTKLSARTVHGGDELALLRLGRVLPLVGGGDGGVRLVALQRVDGLVRARAGAAGHGDGGHGGGALERRVVEGVALRARPVHLRRGGEGALQQRVRGGAGVAGVDGQGGDVGEANALEHLPVLVGDGVHEGLAGAGVDAALGDDAEVHRLPAQALADVDDDVHVGLVAAQGGDVRQVVGAGVVHHVVQEYLRDVQVVALQLLHAHVGRQLLGPAGVLLEGSHDGGQRAELQDEAVGQLDAHAVDVAPVVVVGAAQHAHGDEHAVAEAFEHALGALDVGVAAEAEAHLVGLAVALELVPHARAAVGEQVRVLGDGAVRDSRAAEVRHLRVGLVGGHQNAHVHFPADAHDASDHLGGDADGLHALSHDFRVDGPSVLLYHGQCLLASFLAADTAVLVFTLLWGHLVAVEH